MAMFSTPLGRACVEGLWEDVESSLASGASINIVSDRGHTLLHAACLGNNYDVLRMLLPYFQAQLDVDAQSSSGTPLHMACRLDHYTVATLLLEEGADAMALDTLGNTPLHVACAHDHEFLVLDLLDFGDVDVNVQNAAGNTPLTLACGHSSPDIIQTLLDFEAKVDIRNDRGQSALLISIQRCPFSVVGEILNRKPNLESADNNNTTPLHMACQTDRIDVVKALLSAGVRVNETDNDGLSPLDMAGLRNSSEIIQALLQAGAVVSLTIRGREGGTDYLTDGSRMVLRQILQVLFSPNFNISLASQCLEEVCQHANNDQAVRMFTDPFLQRLATRGLFEGIHTALVAELGA